jgi:hypothetical protein
LIHRVYICTNLNSPFVVQDCARLEGNHHTNIFTCSSSGFVLKKKVHSREEKSCCLLPSIPALSFAGANLLQDGVAVQCVPSDQEACILTEFFIKYDTLENWKQGYVPLHNYFSSICFRNPVLLCALKDRFQVQSTPRTAFRQEGEDDEDMAPMHMSMSDAWSEEEGVQQCFPSQEGGLRLIQFESPRWRPKATQVRAQLGVQEQHALKMTPQSNT